jgi:hypothetical protein
MAERPPVSCLERCWTGDPLRYSSPAEFVAYVNDKLNIRREGLGGPEQVLTTTA